MAPSTPICCIYCECCLATLWAHAEYGFSTLWAKIRGATEDTQELMSVGAQDAAAPVAEVVLPTPTPTEHSPRFSSAAAEAKPKTAMSDAADETNVTLQYCMSLPRHILQSASFKRVTHARASHDYGQSQARNTQQWSELGLSAMFYWSLVSAATVCHRQSVTTRVA